MLREPEIDEYDGNKEFDAEEMSDKGQNQQLGHEKSCKPNLRTSRVFPMGDGKLLEGVNQFLRVTMTYYQMLDSLRPAICSLQFGGQKSKFRISAKLIPLGLRSTSSRALWLLVAAGKPWHSSVVSHNFSLPPSSHGIFSLCFLLFSVFGDAITVFRAHLILDNFI